MEFTHFNLEAQTSEIRDSSEVYAEVWNQESPSLTKALAIAKKLLSDVMQYRRMTSNSHNCFSSCEVCLAPHLGNVARAIRLQQPVTFVLPAFPGKSPNLAKVLGPLPDMAEERSLVFLQQLCDRIKLYHLPGAEIILCSDGRVFSDAVGLREEDVTAYQQEISRMIKKLGLHSISTFNLDDVYPGLNFDESRRELMREHGKSLELLKEMVSAGKSETSSHDNKEAHRLYCGMTRFLSEDAAYPGQLRSRASIQKESRVRAYEVIQRSNAWSELIALKFPFAVRLSIHPQVCGAKKLGIRLIDADNWMTPWHGVAVEVKGTFQLVKRSQAEALGAKLIHVDGRPSHYKMELV